jgi:uncharacterized protein YacL
MDTFQTILLLVLVGLLVWQRNPGLISLPTGRTRKLILDTCALIDGRIIELSKSGFVPERLIVPDFILHELQMLADGGDAHKRERARFGLDVVRELQDMKDTQVVIDRSITGRQPNDDKLVALALRLNAPLYTTDFNLNKLAEIKGVRVLNVNELAQNMRPVALPGEHKAVKILQKGSNAKQGVGYLDDGTMVVVDGAARLIGKSVEIEVTRTHQTVAGKMLFGSVVTPPVPAPSKPPVSERPSAEREQQRPATASRFRRRMGSSRSSKTSIL